MRKILSILSAIIITTTSTSTIISCSTHPSYEIPEKDGLMNSIEPINPTPPQFNIPKTKEDWIKFWNGYFPNGLEPKKEWFKDFEQELFYKNRVYENISEFEYFSFDLTLYLRRASGNKDIYPVIDFSKNAQNNFWFETKFDIDNKEYISPYKSEINLNDFQITLSSNEKNNLLNFKFQKEIKKMIKQKLEDEKNEKQSEIWFNKNIKEILGSFDFHGWDTFFYNNKKLFENLVNLNKDDSVQTTLVEKQPHLYSLDVKIPLELKKTNGEVQYLEWTIDNISLL